LNRKTQWKVGVGLAAGIAAAGVAHAAQQSATQNKPPTAPIPTRAAPPPQKELPPPVPKTGEDMTIGALRITVWKPKGDGAHPLVIFSHGFHGSSRQSTILMKTLSDHGYLVIAPNHKDAYSFAVPNSGLRSTTSFTHPERWTDATYRDRAIDIREMVKKLKADANWSKQIDWTKVALMGHSLGGYTALGLAGAWGSWYLPETKAVIALSPYCTPYIYAKTLIKISVPVMYQGGTMDYLITPFIKRKGGALDQTPAPMVFIDFAHASHFAWTDLNQPLQPEIGAYCVAFLDKTLKGDTNADYTTKSASVAEIVKK
jgi:predicted dienelactone hydrolase